jgi:hypothetical protein
VHDTQFCQFWIGWIAEGESFQARCNDAPLSGERHIKLAYYPSSGALPPDADQYVRHMADPHVTKQDDGRAIAGPDRVLIRSIGPGDTFCSISYKCVCPPDSGKPLRAFLRYSGAGRLACVAIPNPRFSGLILEGLSNDRITIANVDAVANVRANSFFTGAPELNAHMEDAIRAIISKYRGVS